MPENCENCSKVIGDSETPHVFQGHIVCTPCFRKLRALEDAKSSTSRSGSSQSGSSQASKRGGLPLKPPPRENDIPMAPMVPMAQVATMPPLRAPLAYSSTMRQNNGPQINVVGLIGLIIAILSVLGCWIPFLNFLTAIAAVIAIILGIVGVVVASGKQNMTNGLAVACIWLSVLSLAVTAGEWIYIFSEASKEIAAEEKAAAEQEQADIEQEAREIQRQEQQAAAREQQRQADRDKAIAERERREAEIIRQNQEENRRIEADRLERERIIAQRNASNNSSSTGSAYGNSASGRSTYSPPPTPPKPMKHVEVHTVGSATIDDLTISFVSIKPLGPKLVPKGVSSFGGDSVVAFNFIATVSADAKGPVQMGNPSSMAEWKISDSSTRSLYVSDAARTVTILPGKSLNFTLYFKYPEAYTKVKNNDMSIMLPASMFDAYGEVEILIPGGAKYKPSATTQPAGTAKKVEDDGDPGQ